jgi:hypothetical protein
MNRPFTLFCTAHFLIRTERPVMLPAILACRSLVSQRKVTAEYVYRFEVSTQFDRHPKNTPNEMKLLGVVALNRKTLLILEWSDLVAKL